MEADLTRITTRRRFRTPLTILLSLITGLLLTIALAACDRAEGGVAITVTGTATPKSTRGVTPSPTRKPLTTPTLTQTPTSPPASPTAAITVQADDLRGLEVQFWHPWAGEAGAVLQEIIDEYNRTNPWEVEVETTAYEGFGALQDAVHSASLGGEWPDLLVGYNFQANHWDSSGNVLADLTPYLEDPKWGYSQLEQADFLEAFWGADLSAAPGKNLSAAKRLGIPMHSSAALLFYNQGWADELGFPEPPDTLFEFEQQACAAARFNRSDDQAENDGSGGWLVTVDPATILGWVYAFGGEIIASDGRGYQLDTPEMERVLGFIREMLEDGCAWGREDVVAQDEFANRRALFYVGNLGDIPSQRAAFARLNRNERWTVLPFPSGNGQPVIDTYGPALSIVRSTPEEQLAAWLVLQWLVLPQNQARWVAANGYLPTRASTLGFLENDHSQLIQWETALELLPYAHGEPAFASWSALRWALQDTLTEVLSPDFNAEQIPDLLDGLDRLAEEVHSQIR